MMTVQVLNGMTFRALLENQIELLYAHTHTIQNCKVSVRQDTVRAQCGISYYDKKGVISGQYYSIIKKLAKIGDIHKSGFESSIEEEINFSEI